MSLLGPVFLDDGKKIVRSGCVYEDKERGVFFVEMIDGRYYMFRGMSFVELVEKYGEGPFKSMEDVFSDSQSFYQENFLDK